MVDASEQDPIEVAATARPPGSSLPPGPLGGAMHAARRRAEGDTAAARRATDLAPRDGEAWLLRGRLDVAALERSFNEEVRRHEALRTTFPGSPPVQRIHPPAPVPLPEPLWC